MDGDARFVVGLTAVCLVASVAGAAWIAMRSGSPELAAPRATTRMLRPDGRQKRAPAAQVVRERGAVRPAPEVASLQPEPEQPLTGAPSEGPELERGHDEALPSAPAVASEPPLSASAPAEEPAPEEAPVHERAAAPEHRELTASLLARWSNPGLCTETLEASAVRAQLISHFQSWDWGDIARIYVDPRVAPGAHLPLLDELATAERDIRAALGLQAERADVFVYADVELLRAAACINDNVVAYYDGALHVVVGRADVRQSVLHEYTHHVLMNNGFVGPTWVQEGVAMQVAGEDWWLAPQWLERLSARPPPLEVMDEAIPYTLEAEEAFLFYARAAAMVSCTARENEFGLRGVLSAFATSNAGALSYQVPGQLGAAAWQRCLAAWVSH
jgi:hypothetical protein